MLTVFAAAVCQTTVIERLARLQHPRPCRPEGVLHTRRVRNLVRVLCLQRRDCRHLAGLQYYDWWALIRASCLMCYGNLICRRVDLSEMGFEGVGRLENIMYMFLPYLPLQR